MLLAQISDTHITVPDASGKNSEIKLRALESCVENINALHPLPDAVIHTGDLSHNGTLDELKLVKWHLEKLKPPYYVTPGNRDCNSALLEVFSERIGNQNINNDIIYAVKNLPINLVSFDTTSPDDNLGVLNFSKIASLDGILVESQKSPTIVFSHHPLFFLPDTMTPNIECRSEKSIKLFKEIIYRHPQIVAFFCGHSHKPLRQRLGFFDANIAPPLCNLLNNSNCDGDAALLGSYQLHMFNDNYQFITEEKVLDN